MLDVENDAFYQHGKSLPKIIHILAYIKTAKSDYFLIFYFVHDKKKLKISMTVLIYVLIYCIIL